MLSRVRSTTKLMATTQRPITRKIGTPKMKRPRRGQRIDQGGCAVGHLGLLFASEFVGEAEFAAARKLRMSSERVLEDPRIEHEPGERHADVEPPAHYVVRPEEKLEIRGGIGGRARRRWPPSRSPP